MRDVLRGAVVGLVMLALLGAIASRAGWATIDVPRPDGTAPWFLSRATGFAAFAALALDVIVGLLVSTKAGDRWITRAHAIDLHGWLSPVALALVVGHALILLADGYIRFDVLAKVAFLLGAADGARLLDGRPGIGGVLVACDRAVRMVGDLEPADA